MTRFLLDTDTASRLMRTHRITVAAMRRSGASDISISAVSQAELLFGARMRDDKPAVMATVRTFLARITVYPWDDEAAEHHAVIRVDAIRQGRGAGEFDIMIAAHAKSLGATLVTGDKAIGNLEIAGLSIVDWSKK
jgi:tRNA(fMet)-specific endonuclease VapC